MARKLGAGVWGRGNAMGSAARGQAAVEFALSSILLLALIAGVLDLGRGVYARAMVANAAREGARYGMAADRTGSMSGSCATVTYCRNIATAGAGASPSLGLGPTNFTVQCDTWTTGANSGTLAGCANTDVLTVNRLTVCVAYTFRPAAARLVGITAIAMRDCTSVNLQ